MRDLVRAKKDPTRDTVAKLYPAAIVEASDDAIIGKTLDGTIVSWNKGAEKMYGYKAEEVLGHSIAILLPPGKPDELPGIMKRLRRGQRIENYETTRVRKFLGLFKPVALGERIDGWRVCGICGWDKWRVVFVVMVERRGPVLDQAASLRMPGPDRCTRSASAGQLTFCRQVLTRS
jgi:PAS domain S-box-containing protein